MNILVVQALQNLHDNLESLLSWVVVIEQVSSNKYWFIINIY